MEGKEKIIIKESDADAKGYTVVESFDIEKAKRMRAFELQKRKALSLGVEPFDVKKALEYYYPDDLTGDENEVEANVASLESDYYFSGAKTIKEWAKAREEYDRDKDS